MNNKINFYFRQLEAGEISEEFSRGQQYAYRAWRNTKEHQADIFEATELPWGSDLEEGAMVDFVSTLRDAGVKTFAVTDHSTALMAELHAIFETGCTLIGPCTVKLNSSGWWDKEHIGLEFKIN